MKHLKTYQLFESSSEDEYIKDYLNDIFLDLKDSGYYIYINPNSVREYPPQLIGDIKFDEYIYVSIDRKRYHFYPPPSKEYVNEEVIPSVDHAISFLSDLGFNDVKILYSKDKRGSTRTYPIQYKNLKKKIKEKPVEGISLEFRKSS